MSRMRRAKVRYCESTDEENMDDTSSQMDFEQLSHTTAAEKTKMRIRGRGPSKRPCLNRNALMARENRMRKKAYMEKIEAKLSFYQEENKNLTTTIQKQAVDIKRLTNEVTYLRSILNNNTNITALLKALNNALRNLHDNKCKTELNDQPPAWQRADCTHVDQAHLHFACGKGNVVENELGHLPDGIQTPKQDVQTFSTAYSADAAYSTTTTTTHTKRPNNCKRSVDKKTARNCTEPDYTYTVSKDSTVMDVKREPSTREVTDIFNLTDNATFNDHLNRNDYQNLMPITPMNTPKSDLKEDLKKADINLSQLPLFSLDIFDDFSKSDDMMNSVDNLRDTSNQLGEDNLFPSLDDAGICLHLNSDKVSLEFCSICQTNSKNFQIE